MLLTIEISQILKNFDKYSKNRNQIDLSVADADGNLVPLNV